MLEPLIQEILTQSPSFILYFLNQLLVRAQDPTIPGLEAILSARLKSLAAYQQTHPAVLSMNGIKKSVNDFVDELLLVAENPLIISKICDAYIETLRKFKMNLSPKLISHGLSSDIIFPLLQRVFLPELSELLLFPTEKPLFITLMIEGDRNVFLYALSIMDGFFLKELFLENMNYLRLLLESASDILPNVMQKIGPYLENSEYLALRAMSPKFARALFLSREMPLEGIISSILARAQQCILFPGTLPGLTHEEFRERNIEVMRFRNFPTLPLKKQLAFLSASCFFSLKPSQICLEHTISQIKKYTQIRGQCMEFSLYIYHQLQKLGIAQVEMVAITNGDHVFVVVNRNTQQDLNGFFARGLDSSAYVIDGLLNKFYRGDQIQQYLLAFDNRDHINYTTPFNPAHHTLAVRLLTTYQFNPGYTASLIENLNFFFTKCLSSLFIRRQYPDFVACAAREYQKLLHYQANLNETLRLINSGISFLPHAIYWQTYSEKYLFHLMKAIYQELKEPPSDLIKAVGQIYLDGIAHFSHSTLTCFPVLTTFSDEIIKILLQLIPTPTIKEIMGSSFILPDAVFRDLFSYYLIILEGKTLAQSPIRRNKLFFHALERLQPPTTLTAFFKKTLPYWDANDRQFIRDVSPGLSLTLDAVHGFEPKLEPKP